MQPLDPITKKGKKVCTVEEVAKLNPVYINQNDAKSTLFTGTVWDTVMKWLKESGYDVEGDSSLYGNYCDDSGNGSLKLSGSNENWKMNNIYDLAGNIAETGRDEEYILNSNTRLISTSIIVRGGSYKNKGNEMSISSRAGVEGGQTDEVNDVGSRLLIIVGDMSTIM